MILGFSGGIRGSANARRSLYDVPTAIAPVPRGGSCDSDFSRYCTVRALLAIRCIAIAPRGIGFGIGILLCLDFDKFLGVAGLPCLGGSRGGSLNNDS